MQAMPKCEYPVVYVVEGNPLSILTLVVNICSGLYSIGRVIDWIFMDVVNGFS